MRRILHQNVRIAILRAGPKAQVCFRINSFGFPAQKSRTNFANPGLAHRALNNPAQVGMWPVSHFTDHAIDLTTTHQPLDNFYWPHTDHSITSFTGHIPVIWLLLASCVDALSSSRIPITWLLLTTYRPHTDHMTANDHIPTTWLLPATYRPHNFYRPHTDQTPITWLLPTAYRSHDLYRPHTDHMTSTDRIPITWLIPTIYRP